MKFANWTCISSIVLFIALTLVPTLPAQTQTLTVLHNFTGVPDGDEPTGGLLLDAAGNLYGVTSYGCAPSNCGPLGTAGPGCGTVFKLTPGGAETLLHSFSYSFAPVG